MIIEKTAIPALLDSLAGSAEVLVPSVVDGVSKFAPWDQDVDLRLDLQNTKLPPKDLLFPATEKMYRWTRKDGELSIEQEPAAAEPFVLFGVRPCDVLSIDRLDDVFLTKGYIDEFYRAKRDALLIVAIGCAQTGETCFCESMGGTPNEAPSADILLREAGDAYTVAAQTPKGEEALASWSSFTSEGDATPAEGACTLSVNMAGVAEYLPQLFDSTLWDQVSNTCLTCGTCTYVCPTCHCFDISQERRADEGNRFRCWDSCMFTDYTLMAGNHNPRSNKSQRVRQRFMHKLCYFEQRYGSPLCVGCGRCLIDCPAAVDITRIVDRVNELRNAPEPAPEPVTA